MNRLSIFAVSIIAGFSFCKSAASAPTADTIMMACAAITASAHDKLDANVERIAGSTFNDKVMDDCEWLIEGANGDPKLASHGYKKIVKHYEDWVNKNISSPLTTDTQRYIFTNLLNEYKQAMSEVVRAAGDYKYLQQQADVTKRGMGVPLDKK
ncbi:hypothetical protein L2106_00700 [Citrobacter portucalensis]|uniref:Uncharacterized protein n=1 Tax=Enterobacter cloacae TaxID=550 RepID=A0A4Q2E8M9_ENTCL|nr:MULTISPECIES: hypothetical protein [Enterobacteriaceae]EBY4403019.1 hypothetical protein [Salmonella enterica subsp. enterica serovar Brunei]EIT8884619.1 hypothetical protein [Salmonella enterica subsp. enterica serovar Tananarive]MDJ6915227.1 hypothetical protein [Salmonella enterica]MDU3460057.1 hypothetical protein [Streptococcus oralis]AMH12493.1 hypothetical protein AL515_00835 [Citrobacter sp. FDAARGOS_156]